MSIFMSLLLERIDSDKDLISLIYELTVSKKFENLKGRILASDNRRVDLPATLAKTSL